METSKTESTLSIASYPIKKRIDPLKDKDSLKYSINLITNLFNVSLIEDKMKSVFIFGINLTEKYREEEPKIYLMRKCQRLQIFDKYLKQYFIWYKITGLSLFGKIKEEYLKILNQFELTIYIPSDLSMNKAPLIISLDQLIENFDSNDYVITLTLKKKQNISDLKQDDDKKEYNQIQISFFNSIINKLLLQLGFKKETTTKKVLYYRESDMKKMAAVTSNAPSQIFSFFALKANCDSYEGGNIYLKLLPKRILKSDERYSDSFSYLFDNNLNENTIEAFKRKVINQKGITTYNSTIIKIEDVEFVNPFTIFFKERGKEKSISVGEYLKNKYNLNISDTQQLMAVRYIDFNKKIPKSEAKKLYFPMKYLGIIGNPFNLRINIRDLIEKPQEKMERIKEIRSELIQNCLNNKSNDEGIESAFNSSLNPVKVEAFVLNQPTIIFGDNIRVLPNDNGRFELNNIHPFDKIDIKNIQIFLIGINDQEGGRLYGKLEEASKQLHIRLSPKPKIREFHDDFSDKEYEETFHAIFNTIAKEEKEKKENKNKNEMLQLIFVFLSNHQRETIYKIFKNTLNNSELCVPSQVIIYEKVMRKNSNLSPFTNIFSQIWAKLGQKLYCCDLSFVKTTLVMAYAVTQYGNRTLTSLCFNLNDYKAQYCFQSNTSDRNDNRMSTILRSMIKNAISILWKNSRRKVENIVIYREGINERQLKGVKLIELPDIINGIQDSIKHIEEYVDKENKYQKQKGYWKESPKICLVIVNKFNEIKMFVEDKMNTTMQFDQNPFSQYNKAIINIPVGTIVDRVITNELYYDFHLNSAHSSQGTNTPTHYLVVYDTTELSALTLINLTFILTYLCYNTVQSIKVPAPLYFVVRRNQFIKDHLETTFNKKMQIFNLSL